MNREKPTENFVQLMAEPSRYGIMVCLMDGSARPAGELARIANISTASASRHLSLLLNAGALRLLRQGKHRYYSLAGPDVALAVEHCPILESASRPTATLRISPELRAARSCYDHLAGALGVQFLHALLTHRWLAPGTDGYVLTDLGCAGMTGWGVDVHKARCTRRQFAASCCDWSERLPHLSGALAAECLRRFIEVGWLVPGKTPRQLHASPIGRQRLEGQGWNSMDGPSRVPAQT